MGKNAKRGKYRDSKHYREWKGKAAKPAQAPAMSALDQARANYNANTPKYTPASSSYGNYGMGAYCTTIHWQDSFDLGDGDTIFVSAWSDRPKSRDGWEDSMRPDYGVYWETDWATRAGHVTTPGLAIPGLDNGPAIVVFDWQDYGVPDSMDEFETIMRWTLRQVQAGKIVDTGCFAAHGRTGTALAALLILKGMRAKDAMQTVRDKHCHRAVEVASQEKWLWMWDARVNGRPVPVITTPRVQRAATPAKVEAVDAFGRTIAEPITPESELNDLSEAEAYSQWLRLNTAGMEEAQRILTINAETETQRRLSADEQLLLEMHADRMPVAAEPEEFDWCDWCDLPSRMCACEGWEAVTSIDPNTACEAAPCLYDCTPDECYAAATRGDAYAERS